MKQKSRFSCLAVLFAVIAALLPATAHSQVHYRGFVETGAGFNTLINYETVFAYTLSTTHGVQFKRNFLGSGAGIQTGIGFSYPPEGSRHTVMMPIYLAYRYDAFRTQKFNFFGDIKPGILVGFKSEDELCLYLKVGGGLRQRISNRCGLSYGIHYFIAHQRDHGDNMGVLLSIGLDF